MSSYERLPDLEDVSFEPSQQSTASSSSPATLPVPSQVVDGSVPTVLSAPVRDGVFNNLKAAPATKGDGKAFEELEPPSYAEAAHDRVPTYYETTVIASGFAEDGEVLIEGLPVGDFFSFVVNMLVSMSFDFIGFLLTAMLATSHAARCGSRTGFGITLVRYGFFMRTQSDEIIQEFDQNYDPYGSPDELREEEAELEVENQWLSLIFIFLGFFIMMRAQAEYIRAKRLQAVVAATSDVATA